MFFTVHPLILQQVSVRVPGLVRQPCDMRALVWRPTVRIRIKTLWISVYLTAEIWNFVLEAAKWHFQTLKREQKRY